MVKKAGCPIQILDATHEKRSIRISRSRAAMTTKRTALRADMVLRRFQGIGQREAAAQLGVSAACINKWSQRFELQGLAGLAGLEDAPGRGRKPSLPAEKIRQVVVEATQQRPGKKRWSLREMARAAGIGRDSVHRIWRANEIKPHRVRTFKISTDKNFEEKFWDVIGLYRDTPEKASVLCCNEKSPCQALERTQPGLPLGVGHMRTRTHDYVRHGTITLFAALNYLDGKIISPTETKHTHVQWLHFLKQINRETPTELAIHLILDNYCTHKHEKVKAWLARHPRFHLHFPPTSSSWMNMVERFFADLTADGIAGEFHQREGFGEMKFWNICLREMRHLAPTSGRPRGRRFWRKSSAPKVKWKMQIKSYWGTSKTLHFGRGAALRPPGRLSSVHQITMDIPHFGKPPRSGELLAPFSKPIFRGAHYLSDRTPGALRLGHCGWHG